MSIHLKGTQGIYFSTGSVVNPALVVSKSFHRAVLEVDPNDGGSFQIRIPSESFGGNFDRIAFYISSSGRIGVGTQDPQTAFDIRDIGEDTEITSSIAKAKVLSLDRTKGLLSTNITASGNISSSGHIHANKLILDGVESLTNLGLNKLGIGEAGTYTTINLGRGNQDIGSFEIATRGFINTQSHITASGNISSSGDILTSANITSLGIVTAASIASTATFTVAQGGTGATSFADKSVIITQDSGTDTLAAVAMSTNGQLLIGGTNGPAVAVPTGGDGLSVTVGDGTLEYDLDTALTTVTSLLATDIKIGEDDQTKIDFETADEIHFYAANVHQVKLVDNAFTPQADSDVDLGASGTFWKDAYIDTITTTGDVDVLGNIELGHASDTTIARASAGQITVEGTAVLLAGAQTGVTSILSSDLVLGEDAQTKIDFETADEIHFYAANVEQVYLADNIFGPQSDSDVDLGTTGERWKDAYIDTVTTTTLDAQHRYFDTGSAVLGSNGGAMGDIVKFGASDTTAGHVYFLTNLGSWANSNATDTSAATGSLAVALGSRSDTDGMLLKGMVHLSTDPAAGMGSPVFLSTTANQTQASAPTTSGNVVRIIGHQISSSGVVYFNPSPDFIEIA